MNPKFCPDCETLGKQTTLEKIFAIPEDELKSLPSIIQITDVANMLNRCVIVDRGYCTRGHGLVETKQESLANLI